MSTDPDPTTVVILIGNDIFFRPSVDSMSVHVTQREDLNNCLESQKASSIGALHLVMKEGSVETLFDPDAIQSFAPLLCSDADICVHIMDNPGDERIEKVKMALVLASLKIVTQEDGGNGTQIVVAKKIQ